MSTTTLQMASGGEPQSEGKADESKGREAMIRARVLKSLGRPDNLFCVSVIPLWGNNYRVNVMAGPDATTLRIPNSYFVVVDDNGNILHSTPTIRNEY